LRRRGARDAREARPLGGARAAARARRGRRAGLPVRRDRQRRARLRRARAGAGRRRLALGGARRPARADRAARRAARGRPRCRRRARLPRLPARTRGARAHRGRRLRAAARRAVSDDLLALRLTLALAATSTAVLLVLGTPLAWWLARTRWRGKSLVEAAVALPLVLPPTVLGFYLLLALGPHGPLGALGASLGLRPLVFTFPGLVVGSVVYSLPFVVQPLQAAFEEVGERALAAAATLGAGPWDRFFTV